MPGGEAAAVPDPTDLGPFYLELVGTVVGLAMLFQLVIVTGGMRPYLRSLLLLGSTAAGSLAVTLLGFLVVPESRGSAAQIWGILALHILAVASFTALAHAVIGRWSIPATWFFFMVLGGTYAGQPALPAQLPRPFAFASEWLPSAATADALWDASYLTDFRHTGEMTALGGWAAVLLVAWLVVGQRRGHGSALSPRGDVLAPAGWEGRTGTLPLNSTPPVRPATTPVGSRAPRG